MVLASQFNSFIDPFTVFVALPFSFSGAFLGLLIGGQTMNLFSMIGLILLMGIVKKNSILLVDFTNQIRDGGQKDVKAALLEACPNRLRPILMTTFAMIAGMIPLALALGEEALGLDVEEELGGGRVRHRGTGHRPFVATCHIAYLPAVSGESNTRS